TGISHKFGGDAGDPPPDGAALDVPSDVKWKANIVAMVPAMAVLRTTRVALSPGESWPSMAPKVTELEVWDTGVVSEATPPLPEPLVDGGRFGFDDPELSEVLAEE
ncbi:unnamed protein product, partial [Aphanomyces euteiches]